MADAIYYPMLRFHDVGWLKTSALYWDSIARIVPPTEYEDLLDGDAAKLRESGVVCDLPAEGDAMYKVASQFEKLLNPDNPSNRIADLQARYDVGKALAEDSGSRPPSGSYTFADDYEPKLGYLLRSRLASMLQHRLVDAGLAKTMKTDGWLGVHPALADITLRALAVAMSGTTGRRPLTDSISEHATMPFALDSLEAALLPPKSSPSEVAGTGRGGDERFLLEVALQTIQIADPAEVPVDLLLEVRRKWGPEVRRSFVESVEDEVAKLLHITSETERAFRIKRWQDDTRNSLDRLNDALDRAKLKSAVATVSATIGLGGTASTLLAWFTAIGLGGAPILALGASAALALVPIWLDIGEKPDEIIRGSNVGWLAVLKQSLSPVEVARRSLEPFHQLPHY